MISMAGSHSAHFHGSFALEDGTEVGVARIEDTLGLAIDHGTLHERVMLTRGECRRLALTLINATQIDREGED
jgi:hypothetical protein